MAIVQIYQVIISAIVCYTSIRMVKMVSHKLYFYQQQQQLSSSAAPPHKINELFYCCLPVIILERLVPEKQVSEAETGRQRRHLALLLLHPKSGDV